MSLTGEGVAQATSPEYQPIERQLEAQLLEEALAANPEINDCDAQYGLLTIGGDSPYSNIARALEARVFGAYFQNDSAEMSREYGPYEFQSTFFLMVDRQKLEPAGVMRVIRPSDTGFKSSNDLPSEKCQTLDGEPVTSLSPAGLLEELDVDPDKTLDVATIAAHPDHGEKKTGSPIVLASLMRAVYRYSLRNDYDDLIAIIDGVPLSKMEAVGLPINTLANVADSFKYLGAEDNSFINIPVNEAEASVKQKNRQLYDLIFGHLELMGQVKLSFQEQ